MVPGAVVRSIRAEVVRFAARSGEVPMMGRNGQARCVAHRRLNKGVKTNGSAQALAVPD